MPREDRKPAGMGGKRPAAAPKKTVAKKSVAKKTAAKKTAASRATKKR